jgi:hypothetical protein
MMIRIDATLPHLATKAELIDLRTELIAKTGELGRELANKPSRLYLWDVMTAMVGAQAAALAAAVLALSIVETHQSPAPLPPGEAFDWDRNHDRQDACRELDQAQRACAAGGLAACDQALIDRLQRQCSAFGPLGQRPR